MKRLESGLTGDRRLTLFVDVESLAERLDAVPGVAGVRLSELPVLSQIYKAESQQFAARDPGFAAWYYSRWAILEGEDQLAKDMAKGRWQHLTGQFSDDEVEGVLGARTYYLQQRAPEFEIEDLRIDVDLQKRYGVRRGLGMESQEFEARLQQIQLFMRMGKRTATYWLSLVQYDDGRFETARNWFDKRVLDEDQQSIWNDAATYNLARSHEALGEIDLAIERLKTEGLVNAHGNRLRARLLASQSKTDE
jgi:tetratricopeptide (TPR) repeat protein